MLETLKVGDGINQKLVVSDDTCWDTGVVKFIFNDKRAIVYEDNRGKEIFIHTHGREIIKQ